MDAQQLELSPVLSIAFVGGGLSSAVGRTHFSACQTDGRWHLEAGAFSRNREVNSRTGKQWHVSESRIYSSWRDLLHAEKDRVDAVAVLTPTPMHAEIVCEALEQGIPVICEKALACSVEECQLIQSVWEKTRGFLAVTYNYSGYPMVRELRSMIEQGALGAIHQLQMEMPQEGLVRPPDIDGHASAPQSWRLQDGEVPTICLDLGDHLHHLANFLTGVEPQAVMADFDHCSSYPGIVDNVKMWVRFSKSITGNLWLSKTAIGYRNGMRVRVLGQKGSAEWYQMDPENLWVNYIDGRRELRDRGGSVTVARSSRYNRFKAGHPAGFVEAFANLYADLADALLEYRAKGMHDNPFVFGCSHALQAIKLFTAARRSVNHGQWENVNNNTTGDLSE